MASKKKAGPAAQGATKAAFIRSQPASVPAAAVVAAATQKGLTITADQVHSVRSRTRRKHRKGATKQAVKPATKQAPKMTAPMRREADSRDRAFVEAALAIGFARAEELLAAAKRGARAAI